MENSWIDSKDIIFNKIIIHYLYYTSEMQVTIFLDHLSRVKWFFTFLCK